MIIPGVAIRATCLLQKNGSGFTKNSLFYNVSRDELYRSRRGQFNEPRNVAIFLTRKLRPDSLKEIGRQFHMEKYSSISNIIERMKKQMLEDRNLKKRVDRVTDGTFCCPGRRAPVLR